MLSEKNLVRIACLITRRDLLERECDVCVSLRVACVLMAYVYVGADAWLVLLGSPDIRTGQYTHTPHT